MSDLESIISLLDQARQLMERWRMDEIDKAARRRDAGAGEDEDGDWFLLEEDYASDDLQSAAAGVKRAINALTKLAKREEPHSATRQGPQAPNRPRHAAAITTTTNEKGCRD